MRISDWSSDVCSSDLLVWPLIVGRVIACIGKRAPPVYNPCNQSLEVNRCVVERHERVAVQGKAQGYCGLCVVLSCSNQLPYSRIGMCLSNNITYKRESGTSGKATSG